MPGRRIGQPGVDLAGEFISALPEPLRSRTDARRRRLAATAGRSNQYPRAAMLAMSSTSCTRRRSDAARRVKAVAC
jgi:hypothetical protein